MPKAPAENALVKKEMTKVKNCTKKYRKAVRAYYKASATLNKCPATNTKRRASLYKKTEKANAKAAPSFGLQEGENAPVQDTPAVAAELFGDSKHADLAMARKAETTPDIITLD